MEPSSTGKTGATGKGRLLGDHTVGGSLKMEPSFAMGAGRVRGGRLLI